jgi:LPXTG-motif cell wall-anchored protein
MLDAASMVFSPLVDPQKNAQNEVSPQQVTEATMNGRKSLGLITSMAGGALVLAGLLTLPGAASATSEHHKVTICHHTSSDSSPYQMVSVDHSAVDGHGESDHAKHTGSVWHPGARSWGDIIPPVKDVTGGLNWSDLGQAFYNNGCNQPPEPTTTVTLPPVTDPPVTDPPVTDPPVTDPPVTDPPVTDPPVTDPPVTEPEATTTSVDSEGPTTTLEVATTDATTTTAVAAGGPTTTAVSDSSGEIPSTGSGSGALIWMGIIMLLSGLLVTTLARRPSES